MNLLKEINIEEYKQPVDCPGCGSKMEVAIQEIADQRIISCFICEQKIKLLDDQGDARQLIDSMKDFLINLEKELNSMLKKTKK